jgi:hypothetical protein
VLPRPVRRLAFRAVPVGLWPWRRLAIAGSVTLVAAWLSWTAHRGIYDSPRSDFAQIQAAAEGWLAGKDPYAVVGPGREFDQYFPLFYPFTAVLVGVPFTLVTLRDAAFVAVGAFVLAWAISSQPRYRFAWFGLVTPAFIYAVRMSQWTPLLTGAALLPGLGFLLACKPTVGAALWLAHPTRRSLIGASLFAAFSLALFPTWPMRWLADLSAATHIRAPITFHGGPLLLLALLRWRRPEARLLASLSAIPQTPELYEALPLFLVPQTTGQGALLAALCYGVVFARGAGVPNDYVADTALTGQWMVWLLYLPCLLMVLAKPNRTGEERREPS